MYLNMIPGIDSSSSFNLKTELGRERIGRQMLYFNVIFLKPKVSWVKIGLYEIYLVGNKHANYTRFLNVPKHQGESPVMHGG